ncbi:MAG: hypothetical protein Q4B73_04800 [Lachnospiraceae bacterium]|nr:hypothetical protein [Lachnospiraceae bacterium]
MIILAVLKIIGIVLLVILGIILFLACLVLFSPVRYRVFGALQEKHLTGEVKVTWFLHAVSFHLSYDSVRETAMVYRLKILGIPFEKLKALFTPRKKKEKVRKKLKKLKEQDPETYERLRAEAMERRRKEEARVKAEEEARLLEEKQETQKAAAKRHPIRQALRRIRHTVIGMWQTAGKTGKGVARVAAFLFAIPRRIVGRIGKILGRIRGFCATIKTIIGFLRDERTRRCIKYLLQKAKRLFKHIWPKRLKGYIRFGFDDPYQTGLVLAGVEPFFPIWGRNLDLYPVFDQAVLEGEINAKGRIFIIFVLIQGFGLWRNKDVRFVMNYLQNTKEANNHV